MSSMIPADKRGEPLINIIDLVKEYENGGQRVAVLKNIRFQVYPGEMVAVMGPSGSGKSTLLFILGLFLSPTSGIYRFAGRDMLTLERRDQARFRRQQVGFVLQSADLLEHSTVYENLEYPLIYARTKRRERPARIAEALQRVNLSHRIHYRANHLSGGEKQRVAVARALVNNPEVILADEPTGQLDSCNTRHIMEYFARIVAESGTSVVMVTHDPQVAAHCQRVFKMEDGILSETGSRRTEDRRQGE